MICHYVLNSGTNIHGSLRSYTLMSGLMLLTVSFHSKKLLFSWFRSLVLISYFLVHLEGLFLNFEAS